MRKRNLILVLIFIFFIGLSMNLLVTTKKTTNISWIASERLSDIDGKMLEINDFFGKKYTILNFWATWCAPCVEEMPILSELYNNTKTEGISVIGLAIDNEKNVKEFLQKIKVDHNLLIAGSKGTNIMENIGLNPSNSLPFTIMFDKNYDVIKIKLGKLTLNELLYWVNTAER
ncbi:MAG: TlpA family protein disulfide reductase [Burkholderiaceae bacterium]|nr:MAG: TlpA family protein disulfide reductase [Burkholderiaceae bacterium]